MKPLSARELNRALLARQLLLERSQLPLVRAVEQVGGLQTQYAPTAYIGLWTRLERFERSDLTRALERRRVVQGTLLRGTIHVVSPRDWHLFGAAIEEPAWEWTMRLQKSDPADVERTTQRARELLLERPRTRKELNEELGPAAIQRIRLPLVRVPPSGTWERRRADLFGLAETWLGPSDASAEDGRVHLLRRYLTAFGPAKLKDAAQWAGGSAFPVRALHAAAERLRLRELETEAGERLLDLPRAPLPPGDTPAPPRFLGHWEAALLVHCRRTRILPEEYRQLIFNTKAPHSFATFLVDGAVAGTWRHEGGRVELEPFEPLPRAARRHLDDEARRLERFLA